MSLSELACTYATLILHDEDISITSDKIATLVKAASVNVESYWPSLFAKLADKRNVGDLIMNIGSSGAAAPVLLLLLVLPPVGLPLPLLLLSRRRRRKPRRVMMTWDSACLIKCFVPVSSISILYSLLP
ncbi:60S acidic ribosomal protein [Salix suchowensis]|nr:60S acidic ribosomal protein [Salix suchowensis]